MPKKWKLYQLGARLILKGRSKDEDIPVEVIDWFEIEGAEATYRVKTDKGEEIICGHNQLAPPEK